MSLRRWTSLFAMMMVGCGGAPERPAGPSTGAAETAVEFFLALGRDDWPAAYGVLHDESKKSFSLAHFTERGRAYRKQLGFDLESARVRLCEENGDQANAHLTLSDAGKTLKQSAREAVVLRKSGEQWRVVLPAQFGSKRVKGHST